MSALHTQATVIMSRLVTQDQKQYVSYPYAVWDGHQTRGFYRTQGSAQQAADQINAGQFTAHREGR